MLNFTRAGLLIAAALLFAGCGRLGQRAPLSATPLSATSLPPAVTVTWPVMPPGTTAREMNVEGQIRRYRLHIPTGYHADHPMPLVINLHGYSSNAEQVERLSQMSEKADAAGYVAAYPEGLGNPQGWRIGNRSEGQADVQFIRELIATLQSQIRIDDQRIFVTGISNGGEMSYRLACDLPDVIAAFAPVAGGYPAYQDCDPPRPVPVVLFHGTSDLVLPYTGYPPELLAVRDWATQWAARNGCAAQPAVTYQKGDVKGETWSQCREGADVVLYTIDGKGHTWPGARTPESTTTRDIDATDAMWAFFMAHPKPASR